MYILYVMWSRALELHGIWVQDMQTDVVGRFINSEGRPGCNIPGDLVGQSVCHMLQNVLFGY